MTPPVPGASGSAGIPDLSPCLLLNPAPGPSPYSRSGRWPTDRIAKAPVKIPAVCRRNRRSLEAVVIVTFLAMTRFAAGEQLPLKIYTTVDGLPSDRIRSILLDSRGFLWLGTEDGVSRFDGYGFTNLTTSERVTAKAAGAYATADPSGNGEGQTFICFANVTTDASCNATFGPLVFAVPPGQAIFTDGDQSREQHVRVRDGL